MALIIALVLLLVLTLLALAAGQVAVQQQRMVANTQAAQSAYEHAEHILREIEARLHDDGHADHFAVTEPIQSIFEAGASSAECRDAWNFNWRSTIDRDDTASCQTEPCFQLLRFFHQDGDEIKAWPCMPATDPGEENYYLITALGQSGRARSVVQSVYRTQLPDTTPPGEHITARLRDGRSVTISGNGLEDPPVQARLTLTDSASGQLVSELVLAEGTGQPQGLFAPSAWLHTGLEAAGSGNAWLDRVYAGDVQGNLWRVDVGAGGGLSPAFGELPLFTVAANQPIAARPALAVHPGGGLIVYFGSGICQTSDDALADAAQTFYAVRDRNQPAAGADWSLPLAAYKERVPLGARVIAGQVMFTSFEPAADSCYDGQRRLYVLDAVTGEPGLDAAGPIFLGQGPPLPLYFEWHRPQDHGGDLWDTQLRLWHTAGSDPVIAGHLREGRQTWRAIE